MTSSFFLTGLSRGFFVMFFYDSFFFCMLIFLSTV
uniref:Uncharacterized protein n=1 Tax=Rhizophora mucronata TaxID=61149 RepID=A0A2P2Q1I6_RHIMU